MKEAGQGIVFRVPKDRPDEVERIDGVSALHVGATALDGQGSARTVESAEEEGGPAEEGKPKSYATILEELSSTGAVSDAPRRALAHEAFRHTASYDAAIAGYFSPHGL